MLVLSRRKHETIVIADKDGKEIGKVCVADIPDTGKVRLGFTFPKEITIHRLEVWEKIEHKNS